MHDDRPERVALGVERFAARTPTLPPATHTNSYALGTRQVVLVEPATPFDDERRAWIEWARGLASWGRELMAIVVTHYHPDHVGGARFFSDELQLPVWAHAETAHRIDVPVARHLDDGEHIVLDGPEPSRWTCLHTPGHAPDHLCFLDEAAAILVAGDMVASIGTILIAPGDGDLTTYLEQLARLEQLGARLALPAHGGPVERPHELFRHYIEHRLGRERKVVSALGRAAPGGGDLDLLVADVYDEAPRALWPIAKLSLESHLLKLEQEGRALRTEDRWALVST